MEYFQTIIVSVIIVFYFSISTTIAVYSLETMDDTLTKRSFQRRSFVDSFCTRRCSMGKGGNLCKCNGFHFAGKRTAFDSVDDGSFEDSDIYRLIEELDDMSTDIEEPLESLPASSDSFRQLLPDIYKSRYKKR